MSRNPIRLCDEVAFPLFTNGTYCVHTGLIAYLMTFSYVTDKKEIDFFFCLSCLELVL